ncbi:hypothetical protein LCGC14_1690740 [marine sediment metagenome]|uniref:Uncharacterized protein n=1 Tax=marine sediment metagenome TaxID=412755 RepID=A0A0F9HL94_9ZZZZ
MAVPSPKSPEIERLLEDLTGRRTAIEADRCIDPPNGCGGPAIEFRSELDRREYAVSGLCQDCQDTVWYTPE